MKKVFLLGFALMAAVFFFTNCSKEEPVIDNNDNIEISSLSIPFKLFASTPDTRTSTTDGSSISWVAQDSINVFHAETGSTNYGTNDKFIISGDDLEKNCFYGTLTEALDNNKSYDWYVLYPRDYHITTPANTSTGYIGIGSSGKNVAQKQAGNSSKAHLAGRYFPLYGKVENVAAGTPPNVSLNQALAVVKIHVTNANAEDLTVTSVSFTATEDIVGTYYIDFSKDTPSFTNSGVNYVSNTANLDVTSGAGIAQNGTADFYIAIKPFTAPAGSELTVLVNGVEKTITIGSSAVSFQAGKIKTINYTFDYTNSITEPTSKTGWYRVEDVSWLSVGDRVAIVANDSDVAMSTTQNANNRGQMTVTKGTDGDYTTMTFDTAVQEFILEEGTVTGSFGFWCDNGDQANKYLYAASSSSNYIRSQVALDANASFAVAIDASANATLTAQGTYTRKVIQHNSASNLFACYASASQGDVALFKYYGGSTPTCTAPTITTDASTVTITADPSYTIRYTTDGETEPTESSTIYTSPFDITAETVIKAKAFRSHYNASTTTTETCTPVLVCADPVITGKGTSFEITCTTEGAKIYYATSTVSLASLDDVTPTTEYTGAVSITETTYVKAFATKSGYNASSSVKETCTYSSGGTNTTVDVTISSYAQSNSWSTGTKYTSVTIDSNITASVDGAGSNSGKYYTSSPAGWRFYQTEASNTSLTISASGNYTIVSVKVDYNNKSNGTLLDSSSTEVASGSTVNVNAPSVSFTVGSTSTSTNAQVAISKITVTYK